MLQDSLVELPQTDFVFQVPDHFSLFFILVILLPSILVALVHTLALSCLLTLLLVITLGALFSTLPAELVLM